MMFFFPPREQAHFINNEGPVTLKSEIVRFPLEYRRQNNRDNVFHYFLKSLINTKHELSGEG